MSKRISTSHTHSSTSSKPAEPRRFAFSDRDKEHVSGIIAGIQKLQEQTAELQKASAEYDQQLRGALNHILFEHQLTGNWGLLPDASGVVEILEQPAKE
jgi:hypothetical protein